MILTFNDYVFDNQTISKTTDIRYPSFEGFYDEVAAPINYEIFNQDIEVCPFCNEETSVVFGNHDGYDELEYEMVVHECRNCGWWRVSHDKHDVEFDMNTTTSFTRSIVYNGILKTFKPGDINLPMNSLLDEFKKRPDVLYRIHPTKLELLVKDILSDHFDSEVRHVGKTADGGVDLLLLNNDKPTLVQVKRRTKKDSVESIATVRDLLGAMFIKDSNSGIIVSTANHFSRTAVNEASKLVIDGKLTSFDLINFSDFCSMLNLVRTSVSPPWYNLANKRF